MVSRKISEQGRAYDKPRAEKWIRDHTRESMGNGTRLACSGRGILRPLVLAPAAMDRLQRGDGGCGALAMDGSNSVRAGIRCCTQMHLGLWVDRARNTCTGRPAEATRGRGLLPLRAEPHVRWIRSGLGWAVGRVRASESSGDCLRRCGCPWRPSIRRLL